MGALASRFHEYKATGMFDGTLSGFWNFALEPMLDHLDAWDAKDIDKARRIWDGGLVQLHEYVADMGRLHIRYKTATWLRGLIPNPFMRAPMPKPKQQEDRHAVPALEEPGGAGDRQQGNQARSLNVRGRAGGGSCPPPAIRNGIAAEDRMTEDGCCSKEGMTRRSVLLLGALSGG